MPDSTRHGNSKRHEWIRIAAGRVCRLCMVVQLDGEFDNTVPCEPPGGARASAA